MPRHCSIGQTYSLKVRQCVAAVGGMTAEMTVRAIAPDGSDLELARAEEDGERRASAESRGSVLTLSLRPHMPGQHWLYVECPPGMAAEETPLSFTVADRAPIFPVLSGGGLMRGLVGQSASFLVDANGMMAAELEVTLEGTYACVCAVGGGGFGLYECIY